MKKDTTRLWKFRVTKSDLGWGEARLTGVLQAIWNFTADNAILGDVGRFTNAEIALGIEYQEEIPFDRVIEVLVQRRWLDEHPVHRLLVHDWHEECEEWIRKRVYRAKKKFFTENITPFPSRQMDLPTEEFNQNKTSGDESDGVRQCQTVADSVRQWLPAQPSPAEPNQAEPSPSRGSVVRVGDSAKELVEQLRPPAPTPASPEAGVSQALLKRIEKVARDGPDYRHWWMDVAILMARNGGLSTLTSELEYVEKCADPEQRAKKDLGVLKKPGAYLASKCAEFLKPHNTTLPAPPKRAAGSG